MDLINQILAGFIQAFKAKNPKIYSLIIMAMVLLYLGVDMAINGGLLTNSLGPRILQWVDLLFMAIVGTKTAPYLQEYLGQVSSQQTNEGEWYTKLIDGFKLKSPFAFGLIATVLITFFVGSQYAIHFGIIPEGAIATLLKVAGYADIIVIILLGSRTGQYLLDNPMKPIPGGVSMQSAFEKASYYD